MRRTFVLFLWLLVLLAMIFAGSKYATPLARSGGDKTKTSQHAAISSIHRPFWAPNRIGDYITNNGQLVSHIPTGSAGMEWPVGSDKHIIFVSGIWLAGIKEGEIVTATAEFVSEFQPGKVTGWSRGVPGRPANSDEARFKLYIINRGDTSDPSRNPDYLNWPSADGAPVDERGKPLLLGTSTAWAVFNDFDDSLHTRRFGSKPMGVEGQMTAWALDQTNALGDMMFFRFKFFNKSGRDITDVYVGPWADIDIGNAVDLVGCDTSLSLGFNYKTQRDGFYGNISPAVGYDLLQGPIVPFPNDTAYAFGKIFADHRNLPMTAFSAILKNAIPFDDPNHFQEVYYLMAGLDRLGRPVINPVTGQVTKFRFSGDPVAGTGWLNYPPFDKRFVMSSGPFTFADGDSQEVAVGIIVAQGRTSLESVTLLKRHSRIAQYSYENNFASSPVPPGPLAKPYPDTTSILLTWDDAVEYYRAQDWVNLDSLGNPTAYTFQGYNIYQLVAPESSSAKEVYKIASFDLIDGVVKIRDDVYDEELGQVVNIIVQEARDTGLQRFLKITRDYIRELQPLSLNLPYYFAVTAYGYNPHGIPRTLESPIRPIEVRPQGPALGSQFSTPYGDTLAVVHVGPSQGEVYPVVLAPQALTGHTYEVRFRNTPTATLYGVWDVTTDTRVDSNRSNQDGSAGVLDYPMVDGVLVKVVAPSIGFADFQIVANANGPINPPGYAAFGFRNSGFPSLSGADRPDANQQTGGGHWGFHTGLFGNSPGDHTYSVFLQRVLRSANRSQLRYDDFEMRFTSAGGYGYWAITTGNVASLPFELWNIGSATPDDPRDDYRMIPFIRDNDNGEEQYQDVFNLTPFDHSISEEDDDPYTDWVYWHNPLNTSPGTAGYDQFVADGLAGTYNGFGSLEVMARLVLVNWNGGSVSHPSYPANVNQLLPETGSVFRIISNKPNGPADVFRFTTPAQMKNDLTLARQQARALVNVFPNPYHRDLIDLDNPTAQFVTFTHLPEGGATIKIFTLSAELVRTLEHTNGTAYEQWDLRNNDGRKVASGIYFAHIDMGAIGVKTVKIVIF